MAKRRKLTAPSAEDLDRIETEFRRETSRPEGPARMAPIAQVAAETARSVEVVAADTRTRLAEAEQVAERYRDAEGRGLVLREIPLEEIQEDALFRDRMMLVREELDELRDSIVASGMRMPIEVFELPEPEEGGPRYGLISGYRRLLVMREILAYTENPRYARIRAIVREPKTSADSFAAIAEENEVRAGLSHFERGRFAALTAANGVFGSVEEAVDRLFPFASKAKRSKVRSFALVFEEIGDMLAHPEVLTEKQGLRLASALRGGAEGALRDALAGQRCETAQEEWTLLEQVVETYEESARDRSRGGRPAKRQRPKTGRSFHTTAGITVDWDSEPGGAYVIRLKGRGLDADLMDSLLAEIRSLLGKP